LIAQPSRTALFVAALLAAFGGVLAWPRPTGGAVPHAVCLVDVSASVRRTRPDWSAWVGERLEAFARTADARGARTWVVAVADGERQLVARGPADALLERLTAGAPLDPVPNALAEGLGSDLASALVAVEPWLSDGRGGRLVWLGDGRVGDDPAAAAEVLERLARRGVAVELVEPPPPTRVDARVERLEAPRQVESGAPIEVRVELALAGSRARATDARLVVELVDPTDGAVASAVDASAAFADGRPERLALDLPAPDDGLWIVRATVRTPNDASAENDALERTLRVGGARTGLIVARERDLAAARDLEQRLDEAGIAGFAWIAAEVGELARFTDAADLVVALEIPPPDLPVEVLEPYLVAGGGLLTLGGPSQHVARDRGPGVDLLPLVCTPPSVEPRDVVLLLDGSGSMQGEPFAAVRSAARDLLLSTPPGDGLSVTVFTEGLHTSALTVRADDEYDPRTIERAERQLARLEAPGGETSIVRSLEQWLRERRASVDADEPPRRAVVVLLTDGREDQDTPNTAARVERLREGFAAANCTLYSVAIGNGVDRAFLAALVPADERRLEPAESELRRAVADAASSDRLLPGPFAVASTVYGTELGLPQHPDRWARASRAVARPGASVLMVEVDGRPLVALWSVGAGRVATCAGAPAWIGDLARYPARFGGLFRHLARRAEDDGSRLVRDDAGLLLTAPAAAERTRLDGRLVLFDGRDARVALEAGPDGFRAPAAGLAALEASALGGWLEVEGLGRWPVPARPPRELRGGGDRLVPPAAAGETAVDAATDSAAGRERAGHPAAAWVLGLAGLVAAAAALPRRRATARSVKAGAAGLR